MLLAHPEAEDLGRFVEGTLDDPQRAAIVHHIADCDDCRVLVVDAADFSAPAKTESNKWWMQIAASLVLVVAIGAVTYHQFHDPLADVKKDSAKVKDGPLEARLSGFAYAPHHTKRGGGDDDGIDPALMLLQSDASELIGLHGSDPKTLHARGIGLLLAENGAKESIAPLEAAASREPDNAKYQNDLAAALIAGGNAQGALAACDRALRIDPNSPDALFNRAVALKALERPDALAAYERYLQVDSTSPWADEARSHIELLRPAS
jgi:hypothetical protein